MIKYIISRVLLLSVVSFFLGWASKILFSEQLYYFFDIEFWGIFKLFFAVIILIIGIIIFNFIFTLLYWKEYITNKYIFDEYDKKKRIKIFGELVFDIKFSIFIFVIDYEKNREKFLTVVYILVIFYIYPIIFNGIPFIHNYSATYGTYSSDGVGGNIINNKIPLVVVPNNQLLEAKDEMAEEVPEYIDDIESKGYIFFQAALIDGYKSYSYGNGFIEYLKCLPYSAVEKIIRVLMLFLLPYIICAIVIEKINSKKKKNEVKFDNVKAEINNKIGALNRIIKIIQKNNLDNPLINRGILSFEKRHFESKLKKIIDNKNWFKAQTLLFNLNSFYRLISLTEYLLSVKTIEIIKINFDNYHFQSSNESEPFIKAKSYLLRLEENINTNTKINLVILKSLLNYIPKNEIIIDSYDFTLIEYIYNDWRKN